MADRRASLGVGAFPVQKETSILPPMIASFDQKINASMVAAQQKTVDAVQAARNELNRIESDLAAFEAAARQGTSTWRHAGSATHFLTELKSLRTALRA